MEQLKLENQLCFPLYAAAKEIVKQYTPLLSNIGLTYTQYITMMVLWEHQQVTAKVLGERLFLDSGTITPVIKRLEKEGLVVRERSKEDERIVIVTLTQKGMNLQQVASSIPHQMASCIDLTPEEMAILYKLLYKILDTNTKNKK